MKNKAQNEPKYFSPELGIIGFTEVDIITTSGERHDETEMAPV